METETNECSVWVTKYALTRGVKHVLGNVFEGYFYPAGDHCRYKIGRECFDNHDDASKHAEHMRTKKLDSLKKQMIKLSGMRF